MNAAASSPFGADEDDYREVLQQAPEDIMSAHQRNWEKAGEKLECTVEISQEDKAELKVQIVALQTKLQTGYDERLIRTVSGWLDKKFGGPGEKLHAHEVTSVRGWLSVLMLGP